MAVKSTKQESSSDKVDALKSKFQDQRNLWKKRIRRMTRMGKVPEKLVLLEGMIRNDTMRIVEEKAKLLEILISLTKILRKKRAEAMIEIKTEGQVKYKNQTDEKIAVEAILCDYLERQELIEMQIDYLVTVIKNLNDLNWGIKNYIELNKMGVE